MEKIFVNYEYGKLIEATVGRANGLYPDINIDWMKKELEGLSMEEKKKAIENSGKKNEEIILKNNKSKFQTLEEENLELIKILKEYKVKIHRPKAFDNSFLKKSLGIESLKSGYIQQFSRDPFVVINDTIIELSMSKPLRKSEIFGYSELFNKISLEEDRGKVVAMNKSPYLDLIEEEYPIIEGGDVLVLGDKILVGNSCGANKRSNDLGFKWLQKYLGKDFEVIKINLKKSVLHLDCALSIPKEGLAIISKNSFIDKIPKFLEKYDFIEVSLEEANKGFACNGISLDENNYILSYNDSFDNCRVEKELNKKGINVEKIYFQGHNDDGGSVRCTCNSLIRKN